jgi:glycosyltransferase involved in cell wall biosynthesis
VSDAGIRVFVLMEHGRGLKTWTARYERGEVQDATPYGLGRAASSDVHVAFSEDRRELKLTSVMRRGLQRVFGFDLIHVVRHKREVRDADIVWTHTEQVHLAYTLLRHFLDLPPAICNSIWIVDEIERVNWLKRALWRFLLRESSINTTESPVNAGIMSKLIGRPAVPILYGIDAVNVAEPQHNLAGPPLSETLKVLAIGNDRDRDWEFFLTVVRMLSDQFTVRIATRNIGPDTAIPGNCTVLSAKNAQEVAELYAWADVVCLPLRKNSHASGVTVAMEAAAANRPVIATNTGGIDSYFPELSAHMMPHPNEAREWARMLDTYRLSASTRNQAAQALQRDVHAQQLTLDGYVGRLVALTRQMVLSK